MKKNSTNLHKINFGKGEYSSDFVVDLRQNIAKEIRKAGPIIKKERAVVKDSVKELEHKIIKNTGKEINYLKREAQLSGPMILRFFKKIKNLSILNLNKKTESRKNKNAWLDIYQDKVSNFKRALRQDRKNIIVLSRLSKRAAKAESELVWYRSVFSFVLVLILIITPLKLLSYFELFNIDKLEKKIVGNSRLAMNNLMAAGDAVSRMDFKDADSQFQNAANNFLSAQSELDKINDSILSLAALSGNPKLKLASESKKFLRAGAIASSLGRNLVLATDSLFSGEKDNFSSALDSFVVYGGLAVSDAKNLKVELAKINPDNLPSEYREKFVNINSQVSLLADNLESFVLSGSKFKDLLGATQDKRYLLVFQNNSELRASGGFIGSYALVDIRDGKIKNLEVPGGGSYDTEGGMKVRVVAPQPLWLVNPLWHFWDANWWPDWPTTANNLMWFYDKSGGPTVDGVISVTPTVMEGLLEITGPIDLTKEYGLVIDSNNFWETIQKVVEQKNLAKTNPEAVLNIPKDSENIKTNLPIKQGLELNSENKPKKIIGDLMAKILEILPRKINKENLIKILSLLEKNLSEKQVLFYFKDESLQKEFSNRNWSGEIRDTKRDYLAVINTNIAGQKSDRKMQEKIEHLSEVALDGSIINTLKITRTHTGVKNEPLTGVRNVDWLRIYVPKGSELLSVDGFIKPDEKYFNEKPESGWLESDLLSRENNAQINEPSGTKIYEENNKTVFANWIMVDPGETKTVTIKYRLPFSFLERAKDDDWLNRINDFFNSKKVDLIPYSFMLQKQAGARASEFSSRLSLPANWPVFWSYPDNLKAENGWNINDFVDSDKYWSILVNKK